jgi:hypothetical protein
LPARCVFELQFPKQLHRAGFGDGILVDLGVGLDRRGALRVGVFGHPVVVRAALRVRGADAGQ